MSKFIEKKLLPNRESGFTVQWNLPRSLFKILDFGMLGLSMYLSTIRPDSEILSVIKNTCCVAPTFLASIPLLITGLKNKNLLITRY